MELVLLWYKTWCRVRLVIQSLLLSTTKQLPNKPLTSPPNMPMTNSRTFQSASGLNTITRPTPRRSGGDYPSGQQVCRNKFGLLLMKTNLFRLRSMIWSSQTFPWPRSSRLLEWMTICGCRPFLTTKNWSDWGDKNQPTLIKGSFGGSLEWGSLIQRLVRRLWMPLLAPWGTPQPLEWGFGRCGGKQRVKWVPNCFLWFYSSLNIFYAGWSSWEPDEGSVGDPRGDRPLSWQFSWRVFTYLNFNSFSS